MRGVLGLPIYVLVLLIVVMPVCVAVFFSLVAPRHVEPLAYRCSRCEHDFRRPPYRAFPATCPRCGARDWHLPR